MADQSLVGAAALNNAECCDVFCRARGIATSLEEDRWHTAVRPPLYYPDAVTLRPGLTPERVLDGVAVGRGCSVKDSYADLDLAGAGFQPLFDAEWVALTPDGLQRQPAAPWVPLTTADELVEWEAAWGDSPDGPGFFPSTLLQDRNVVLLAGRDGERIVAGAIGNRSEAVLGLSNVFETRGELESAWLAGAEALRHAWGDMPVVGYDHGEQLEAAHRVGFESIGELRIWIER